MQKIISYLYPNRIELLADLAGFNVEYTNVYQRNVKIYSGIDNTLEFDIKNADQKRIDLTTYDSISLNIMDASGNPVGNTPYDVTPTLLKGIATVTIPADDLIGLDKQTFKYSVTALDGTTQIILYADSHFTALGKLELIGSAIPSTKPTRTFNSFTGEIDLNGNVISHSSAITAKFYEAVADSELSFITNCTGFVGTIYLEATTDTTISVESFRNSPKLQTWTSSVAYTGNVTFSNVSINDYCYFRICWQYPPHSILYGSQAPYNIQVETQYGTVNNITVS
jgi:hypothetical protein